METTASTADRIAKVDVVKGATLTTLIVTVAHKPTTKELATLQTTIADKIIRDLTGCSCLSGAIEMIFRDEFAQSIRVDLGSGRVL
jgi:hypothetical protein